MKILFLVTEDWYFCSHRLSLARRLQKAGAKVYVMSRLQRHREMLEAEGFHVIPWKMERRKLNPLREAGVLFQVIRAYRKIRPDLVHHVALKPVIYGGLAARICGGMPSVNAIAGTGHVFASRGLRASVLREIVLFMLRLALVDSNARLIFQNEEDRAFFVRKGIVPLESASVVRGTGIDIHEFSVRPEPAGVPVVMLAGRMLWDKGIREFVAAARELRQKRVDARFVLVGKPDPENPSSIPEAQIQEWVESGAVEWWGHQENMAKTLGSAHIVCLPSYAEGGPRVLIEAGACGRAVVATDIPGCRDIVGHGINGLLVPLRDSASLANAIKLLLHDPLLRRNLGAKGREIACREFSEQIVFEKTAALYRTFPGEKWLNGTFFAAKEMSEQH